MFHIVLVEPEIPQNAGNIARTCAATKSVLHMVRPLGFEVSDKYLKRAGLDYWHLVDVQYHDSFEELLRAAEGSRMYFFSSHAGRSYTDAEYPEGVYLVFGCESVGLPKELVEGAGDCALRIPMLPTLRCLNLSNSVAVVCYEVLRGWGFPDML